MTPPSRQTIAGQVYLDLRRLAQTTGRATDELLQLYALEGFLDRLTHSDQRGHFVLKGGVLLAAYDARRATRDIDFAAREIDNDIDTMVETVRGVIAVNLEDGLSRLTSRFSTFAAQRAGLAHSPRHPTSGIRPHRSRLRFTSRHCRSRRVGRAR